MLVSGFLSWLGLISVRTKICNFLTQTWLEFGVSRIDSRALVHFDSSSSNMLDHYYNAIELQTQSQSSQHFENEQH